MKDELKKILLAAAKECFEANENVKTLHVTTDTNCFVKATDAVAHSHGLDDETVLEITREEALGSKADKPEFTAKEVIEKINAAISAEEVDALADGDTRKTVTDAAAAKKTELHNSK